VQSTKRYSTIPSNDPWFIFFGRIEDLNVAPGPLLYLILSYDEEETQPYAWKVGIIDLYNNLPVYFIPGSPNIGNKIIHRLAIKPYLIYDGKHDMLQYSQQTQLGNTIRLEGYYPHIFAAPTRNGDIITNIGTTFYFISLSEVINDPNNNWVEVQTAGFDPSKNPSILGYNKVNFIQWSVNTFTSKGITKFIGVYPNKNRDPTSITIYHQEFNDETTILINNRSWRIGGEGFGGAKFSIQISNWNFQRVDSQLVVKILLRFRANLNFDYRILNTSTIIVQDGLLKIISTSFTLTIKFFPFATFDFDGIGNIRFEFDEECQILSIYLPRFRDQLLYDPDFYTVLHQNEGDTLKIIIYIVLPTVAFILVLGICISIIIFVMRRIKNSRIKDDITIESRKDAESERSELSEGSSNNGDIELRQMIRKTTLPESNIEENKKVDSISSVNSVIL